MASDDPRVQAAIANWAPRFIANGIDYNDFVTTTARIERWDQWCPEWIRTAVRHEDLAREAEERASPLSAALAYARAAICYHFSKFVVFEDMALYDAAHRATVDNFRKALPWLDPPAERVAIPYGATSLPAHLRLPPGIERPPVVVIVSGLDSVKEEAWTFEPLFNARGMATLTFDGPGQGESEALPIEPEFEKPVGAVLDWIARRPDLDAGRVGAVGISLGGYYVARAAAYEPRLKCAVPIAGPYAFAGEFDELPPISQQAFQVRSHSPTLAVARERAARLTLDGVAQRITLPFLIIFGRQDRLIPWQQAERLHREVASRDKHLVMYEDGNHVCNNLPYAYRPLVADWVGQRLAAKVRVAARFRRVI